MNPIAFALRRPFTVMVGVVSVVLACALALRPKWVDQTLRKLGVDLPLQTMKVDVFPASFCSSQFCSGRARLPPSHRSRERPVLSWLGWSLALPAAQQERLR